MSEKDEKVTVRLPSRYLEIIDLLVKLDYYPSRSEAIRSAVRDLIYEKADMVIDKMKKMQEFQQKILTLESFEHAYLKK